MATYPLGSHDPASTKRRLILPPRLFLTFVSIIALLLQPIASFAAGQSAITDTFCTEIQTSIMGNTIPAQNIVHSDKETFVLSKASIDPLRNEQFTELGEDNRPRMVSCKMKTHDHIREFYGETATSEEPRSCEAINRENMAAVIASLSDTESEQRVIADEQIVFDDDLTEFMGVNWLKPFDMAYRGEDGHLHIQSKGLRVDWTSLIFKLVPERFRGALYCHLIAPEYAKALILGEAHVPAPMAMIRVRD